MATLTKIIGTGTATRNRQGWQSASMKATVSDLAQAGNAAMLEALSVAGMPSLGSAHPEFDGLVLDSQSPTLVVSDSSHSKSVCEVALSYVRQPDPFGTIGGEDPGATIECSSSLSQETVNTGLDANDDKQVMTVTHSGVSQGGTASMFVPQFTITVRRTEDESPMAKQRDYVGTVNAANWNVDPSAPAKSYLCTGINGVTADNGETWDVTYSFQFCGPTPSGTWDATIFFIDPETGRPPSDSEPNAEIKEYRLYKVKDFTALGL